MRKLTVIIFILSGIVFYSFTEISTFYETKTLSSEQEIDTIKKIFNDWTIEQIKIGNFLPKDSCNPEIMFRRYASDTTNEMILDYGIPDPENINFSFADLNADKKTDGLITFFPNQCDGGNGSMWYQKCVLIVSKNESYQVIDTFNVDYYENNFFEQKNGFYIIDKISANYISAKYFIYKENDGHCCPHYRDVTFDFKQQKLIKAGKLRDQ